MLSGGGITPARRVDVAAGGAARVPLGELRSNARSAEVLGNAQPGGVTPLVTVRRLLVDDLDIGLSISPNTAELEGRYGLKLGESVSLIGSLAPYAGWLSVKDRETDHARPLVRFGAQSPWVIAMSVGGIYQAWVGVRVGVEHVAGEIEQEGGDRLAADAFRTGALVGLGLGFRRLWTLVELAADYEWWRVAQGDIRRSPHGLSLTPAFVLQLRL